MIQVVAFPTMLKGATDLGSPRECSSSHWARPKSVPLAIGDMASQHAAASAGIRWSGLVTTCPGWFCLRIVVLFENRLASIGDNSFASPPT
jgi:hypothetical protein